MARDFPLLEGITSISKLKPCSRLPGFGLCTSDFTQFCKEHFPALFNEQAADVRVRHVMVSSRRKPPFSTMLISFPDKVVAGERRGPESASLVNEDVSETLSLLSLGTLEPLASESASDSGHFHEQQKMECINQSPFASC